LASFLQGGTLKPVLLFSIPNSLLPGPMPPRILSVVILLFWLSMGAWLFMRDLWPRWRPGEPPPYTLMASDEAPRQGTEIRWDVFHNGHHAYDLLAWTNYRERSDNPRKDDTFEMRTIARVKQTPGLKPPVRRLRSLIRITRDSQLREIHAELHIAVKELELLIEVKGEVREAQLLPRWHVTVYAVDEGTENRVFDRWAAIPTPLHEFDAPFKPFEFTERGIVLNPLHPPNRLDTLRGGQHWRMPLVSSLLVLEKLAHTLDALAAGRSLEVLTDMLTKTLGGALEELPLLEARVLPQLEPLPPSIPVPIEQTPRGSKPPLCWVIEARDTDGRAHGRLWIQHSEGERQGLVLRQEVALRTERGDDLWVVQRE
jgi:hypothetical protein